jgi:membrane associated rhomboid family serine protease
MTVRELFAGEVWRAVTSTFVHYGLLHIGLNLVAFFLIGSMVESWYGPGQFVAIYVLTGGGGNILSALLRHAIGSDPNVFSGGGSTVVMGLVGLCAVVGWRSKTRDGVSLRNAMINAIVMTAGLGLVLAVVGWFFPRAGVPMLDNWGHAGGVVMGVLLGLADTGMLRQAGRMWSKVAGTLAVLVLVASAVAQVSEARVEAASARQQAEASARQRAAAAQTLLRQAAGDDYLMKRLEEIRLVYRAVVAERRVQRGSIVPVNRRPMSAPAAEAKPQAKAETKPEAKAEAKADTKPETKPNRSGTTAGIQTPPNATSTSPPAPSARVGVGAEQQFFLSVLAAAAFSLDSMQADLDTGANSADFRRARDLLRQTALEQPTSEEVREFDDHIATIREHLRKDRDARQAQAQALTPRG